MKKKLASINGKLEEPTSLSEIITGKRYNKYQKYPTKEVYKAALFVMTHMELAEEMLRLGETAKSEKSFMRTRLLEMYDRAMKPRTVTQPEISTQTLEDLLG